MRNFLLRLMLLFMLNAIACELRDEYIVVTGPQRTRVLAEPMMSGSDHALVIAVLDVGDTVQALDYQTLKDAQIYKVKLSDGRIGWVTLGDNCDIVRISQ